MTSPFAPRARPAQPPAPVPPTPPDDAAKTVITRGGGRSTLVIVLAILATALIAGIVAAGALDSSDAASSASEAIDGSEGSSDASGSGAGATACDPGDADPVVSWYCKEVRPAFEKAAADHARIDRLEARSDGAPLWLTLVVIGIGILTVYNTVEARRARKRPPTG